MLTSLGAASPTMTRSVGQIWRERVLWMLAVIAAFVAASLTPLQPRPPAAPEMRVDVVVPPSSLSKDPSIAISPDGRQIAFVADEAGQSKLWVRSIESGIARPLPGTEAARLPFWSDDNRSIGFFATTHLKTISIDTQAVSVLAPVLAPGGGAWYGTTILYTPNAGSGPVFRIAAGGGSAVPVTIHGDVTSRADRHPEFLPDGRHFLYFESSVRRVCIGDLAGTPAIAIAAADSGAVYAHGHLLFVRDGTLVAQPFDSARRRVTGTADAFVDRIVLDESSRPAVSASRAGPIAYRTTVAPGAITLLLNWRGRSHR